MDRGARRLRILAAIRGVPVGRDQLGDPVRGVRRRAWQAYLYRSGLPAAHGRGAVALEAWLQRLAKPLLAGAVLAAGSLIAPMFLPILPVETFIAYQRALGFVPNTGRNFALRDLPQYYADQFGWPEMAEVVGKAYQALPPEDRRRAAFLPWNQSAPASPRRPAGGYHALGHAFPPPLQTKRWSASATS